MILAIDVTKPLESAADKFSYGGQMLLIGMSVVFAVLILLWGALELFHLVTATIEKKTKAKEPAPAPVPASETVAPDDDESELIAVMAAAIAAASEENPEGSFRVVSFRRI